MKQKNIVIGGGGHAKVVIDCLRSAGVEVEAVIDDKYQGDLLGIRRLAAIPLELESANAIIAIGDNRIRERLASASRYSFFNAVHPSAIVSAYSTTGSGTMILHRAVIQAGATIGSHVIVNTGAQVDHDCTIGDFAHIAPGSVLCGSVRVGRGTLVGAGAVIKPGIEIGAWVTIGSGSVVTKNIPDGVTVVGNPARTIRKSTE